MQLFRRPVIPATPAFAEHPILLRNPPYRLIIPLYTFLSQQPALHPAAAQTYAVSLFAPLPNHLCHFYIAIRLLSAFQIVVVSASGYAKEAAHLCYRILAAEFSDCPILDKAASLSFDSVQKIPQQFYFHA